jgi:hypothetical protein
MIRGEGESWFEWGLLNICRDSLNHVMFEEAYRLGQNCRTDCFSDIVSVANSSFGVTIALVDIFVWREPY